MDVRRAEIEAIIGELRDKADRLVHTKTSADRTARMQAEIALVEMRCCLADMIKEDAEMERRKFKSMEIDRRGQPHPLGSDSLIVSHLSDQIKELERRLENEKAKRKRIEQKFMEHNYDDPAIKSSSTL